MTECVMYTRSIQRKPGARIGSDDAALLVPRGDVAGMEQVKMSKLTAEKELCAKLEYAVTLIETMNAKEKSPVRIVEVALTILEFGKITPKEFLDYIEATGK